MTTCFERKHRFLKGDIAQRRDFEREHRSAASSEVAHECEQIREDAPCSHFGAGARSSDDERLLIIPFGPYLNDVVRTVQLCEGVGSGIPVDTRTSISHP
jgi:hypothetical protein